MRIRIKFTKSGAMRFVGHLDMMRYFQKAIRRAGIDISYTTGFSPHQIMSFAAPLGVGITSDGEYMDIEVNSTDTSENSVKALNAVMARGVTVTGYFALREGAKKAMTAVAAADYLVYYKTEARAASELACAKASAADLLSKDKITVTKQTKKGERTLDLKPLIYDLKPYEEDGISGFYMRLCTGSTDNIKPQLVMENIYDNARLSYDPLSMQIHRLETLGSLDGALRPLSDAGNIITAAVIPSP